MKRFIFTLTAVLTMALSVNAMSYNQARNEAMYLTDKMAYELGLSPRQREAAYRANLSYLTSVNHHRDLYGSYWARRNADLRYILDARQYHRYAAAHYFYRPLAWERGAWIIGARAHYATRHGAYVRPVVAPAPVRHARHHSHQRRGYGRY